jgi:hypothetical protein
VGCPADDPVRDPGLDAMHRLEAVALPACPTCLEIHQGAAMSKHLAIYEPTGTMRAAAGRDHRHQPVVQTGAANSLGRQTDPPVGRSH